MSINDRADASHALGYYSLAGLDDSGVARSRLGEEVNGAKYRGDQVIARAARARLASIFRSWVGMHPLYRAADLVTWVPPSSSAGTSTNDLPTFLADAVAESIRGNHQPLKSADRLPQKGLEPEDARKNVANKFSISQRLDGLVVLLIDDVYNTGASLAEGVRALRQAGARSVLSLAASKNARNSTGVRPERTNWEGTLTMDPTLLDSGR